MTFVLDASVTMGWLFLDSKPAESGYALKVLAAMKRAETGALVPVTWGLEGGSLPAGVALSPAGVLSGTPERAERTVAVVRVSSGSARALATYLLNVVRSAPSLWSSVSTGSSAPSRYW